jgi:hypothetical protein
MAITATTLAAACGLTDLTLNVTSATGITAPNFTSGAGITVLFIDQEFISVYTVNGTIIGVQRGQYGTANQAHVNGAQVQIGLPSDFPSLTEFVSRSLAQVQVEGAINWPATFLSGTADAINPAVPGFYVVKTGSANGMTLAAPPVSAEGNVIQIWSDTLFAHTLTATTLLANGTALKTTATFPAFRGAGLILRACNGVWHVLSNGASAGVVVLT